MAWEPFQSGRSHGITGDTPFDEVRHAINRINRTYVERFGRKVYLAELLYALMGVVSGDIESYLSDDSLPEPQDFLRCVENAAFDHIDPGHYEGGLDAESEDFVIFPRHEPDDRPFQDTVVVRGQVVPASEQDLLCRYSVLSPEITHKMAQSLIRQCVLQDLLDYDIVDGNKMIRFEPVA